MFKNRLFKILLALIPSKEIRNKLKNNFYQQEHQKTHGVNKISNAVDGPIYTPYYNTTDKMTKCDWPIYNKDGCKLKPVYIRDINSAHSEYLLSKYLYFDRYAYSLDTHFYSHMSMLEQCGNPIRKYGYLSESKGICPNDYKIFDNYKGLEKDFDLIFTYNYDILNKIDNARFAPLTACLWYGTESGGGVMDKDAYLKKSKNISIISSNKIMCDLHKLRIDIANKCKNYKLADTFGTFDGGHFCKVADTLTDYRFSIAIENEIEPYFFTEKLLNCFASMTIPVYLGAAEINNFFNPDGIIQISIKDAENIEKILSMCTKEEYESRIPAMIDNFNRVQRYSNTFDMCLEDYLKDELQL